MASAALVQANRFAQQGKYDEALRLIEGEDEDSPTSLMVRMVCEWKGLKELDRALTTYDVLRACNEAPPPLLAAAARNADGIRLEIKINAIREAQEVRATTIQEHASAAYRFEEIDLEEPCSAEIRFHALYGAGLHWYQGEDYARSAQCVAAALEQKADFAPAWHVLGECRRHLGDANGALEAFAQAYERAETKHVRDAAARCRVEALIFNGRDAEALEALEALDVNDTLVVWRLDRMGRSLRHLIEINKAIEAKGAHFESLTEKIDTSTAMGEFAFHILGAVAQLEREIIRERTLAGMAEAARQGRFPGRPRRDRHKSHGGDQPSGSSVLLGLKSG